MGKNKAQKQLKERTSLTIDKELLDWLDEMVQKKVFASRSHGIEYCITKAKGEKK